MLPIQQTKRVFIVLFASLDFLVKDIVVVMVVFKYMITVHHILLPFYCLHWDGSNIYTPLNYMHTQKHRSTLTVKLRKPMLSTESIAKVYHGNKIYLSWHIFER